MAMTITQAGAANTLARFLLGEKRSGSDAHYTPDEARDALATLLDGAVKALSAGKRGADALRWQPLEAVDGLDLTFYESGIDGATVVEVSYPGHLRVIVGEGTVFDADTEAPGA